MKVVYVTWDGPTTNYLEGLFFPLFHRLRRYGISTHVIQFSWDLQAFKAATEAAAAQQGVGYEVHAVPRRPLHLATGVSVTLGGAIVARRLRALAADLVVPRSHIPGAIALSARALGTSRTDLVWDSDGLMPDERADFGGWSRTGATYRGFRQLERAVIRTSRRTLTRTEAAATVLAERATVDSSRFVVAPNGKDEALFAPRDERHRAETRQRLGVPADAPLLIHVGSLGPQYRPRELLQFFGEIRRLRADARLILLTGALDAAQTVVAEAGLPAESVVIKKVGPAEVANILPCCDAGVAFREPCFSQRGVAPLKVAEYLLCGLPVITNHGVGDLDQQLSASPAALFTESFEAAPLRALADRFMDELLPRRRTLTEAARRIGERWYSLDAAASAYARAFGVTTHDSAAS